MTNMISVSPITHTNCQVCGKSFLLKNLVLIGDSLICTGCMESSKNHVQCFYSDEWLTIEQAIKVNVPKSTRDWQSVYVVAKIAEGDFFKCDSCGQYYPNGYDHHDTHSNHRVCPVCFVKAYFTCTACNGTFHRKSMGQKYEDICLSCTTRMESNFRQSNIAGRVFSYSENVLSRLNVGAPRGKRSFGIELEYAFSNRHQFDEIALKMYQALPNRYAILKEDSSINRDGFRGAELVTKPETIDYHLESFKSFFDNTQGLLVTGDWVGMHVHVSKKGLSKLTIGKVLQFLNAQTNRTCIIQVADRHNERYAAYNTKKITDVNRTFARYEALNLNNPYTIEFRIFKVPATYAEFAARLQFCDAVVEFCSGHSMRNLTFAEFCKFLAQNQSRYWDLIEYINARVSTATIIVKARKPKQLVK